MASRPQTSPASSRFRRAEAEVGTSRPRLAAWRVPGRRRGERRRAAYEVSAEATLRRSAYGRTTGRCHSERRPTVLVGDADLTPRRRNDDSHGDRSSLATRDAVAWLKKLSDESGDLIVTDRTTRLRSTGGSSEPENGLSVVNARQERCIARLWITRRQVDIDEHGDVIGDAVAATIEVARADLLHDVVPTHGSIIRDPETPDLRAVANIVFLDGPGPGRPVGMALRGEGCVPDVVRPELRRRRARLVSATTPGSTLNPRRRIPR